MRIEKSIAFSSLGHLSIMALLMLGLWQTKPMLHEAEIPVDLLTIEDKTQNTHGSKLAEKKPQPQPKAAEQVAEKELPPEPTKKPVIAPPPEAKPEPQKLAEKPAEPKQPDPKPDLKPEETEEPEEAEIAEVKKPLPPKKPEPPKEVKKPDVKPQPKVADKKIKPEVKKREANMDDIQALLDKRQAKADVGQVQAPRTTASLGTAQGRAAALSASEADILISQMSKCWSPPVGMSSFEKVRVVLTINFNLDGTVIGVPKVINSEPSPFFNAAASAAVRAALQCQPYQLPAQKYENWKEIDIGFDPRHMMRG